MYSSMPTFDAAIFTFIYFLEFVCDMKILNADTNCIFAVVEHFSIPARYKTQQSVVAEWS